MKRLNRKISQVGSAIRVGGVTAALFAAHFPAFAATNPAVTGYVTDSSGTPQIGALVQLLRTDTGVAASVFTDHNGRYLVKSVPSGTYSVKAVSVSYLPTLLPRISVRSNTIVNLTMSTLFEAARWLPAERSSSSSQTDDWAWTLRANANRPLLRMLSDGPVLVLPADAKRSPATRARLTLEAGSNRFGRGTSGAQLEAEQRWAGTRQMNVRALLSAGAASEATVGYRNEISNGRTVRIVGAVQTIPSIRRNQSESGLQSAVLRTTQTLQLSNNLNAEVGSELLAIQDVTMKLSNRPFAALTMSQPSGYLSYRIATGREFQSNDTLTNPESIVPPVAQRNGQLTVERGLHQEVDFHRSHRKTGTDIDLVVYVDHLINPIVGGGAPGKSVYADSAYLMDSSNGMLRMAGQNYHTIGMVMGICQALPSGQWLSVRYANGDALWIKPTDGVVSADQLASLTHAVRTQMVALSAGGESKRTGTRWRSTYRWQPSSAVTDVAPYSSSEQSSYLSLMIRQQLPSPRGGPGVIELVLDMRNMLAQGYRPVVLDNGSAIYFANTSRSLQAGLAFTF